jgi:hypothetical protein
MGIIIDRFSAGLDDMKRIDQKSDIKVLVVLNRIKKFSVFEAIENQVIANTMDRIFNKGYVESTGGEYPWTKCKLTDSGIALISKYEDKP